MRSALGLGKAAVAAERLGFGGAEVLHRVHLARAQMTDDDPAVITSLERATEGECPGAVRVEVFDDQVSLGDQSRTPCAEPSSCTSPPPASLGQAPPSCATAFLRSGTR